jgi:hypothetical protein
MSHSYLKDQRSFEESNGQYYACRFFFISEREGRLKNLRKIHANISRSKSQQKGKWAKIREGYLD